MSHPSTIAIIGTGYVGLASAIGFAELGHSVIGYDIVPDRVRQLKRGIPAYQESGLQELLRRHLALGNIRFTESFEKAVATSNVIVVAVQTPALPNGGCDLSAVESVFDALARAALRYPTVVLRSTVPPGTTARLARRLEGLAEVIMVPEFLREGNALYDFLNPDRIVIGSDSREAADHYAALISRLQRRVLVTSPTNAELIKGFSNAFLAMKISFANEVANACEGFENADSLHVLRGIGLDRRIGEAFLEPGIGFGGPCFEKDIRSLIRITTDMETETHLLNATLAVNEAQPRRIVNRVEAALGTVRGARIGVWGVTFKAGTDDVRDSLAIQIINDLQSRGATVIAYDPSVSNVRDHVDCLVASSALEAAEADALVILTEWPQFRAIDVDAIAARVRSGIVIDGRNVLDPHAVADAGLHYHGVGRRAAPRFTERAVASVS